MAGEFFFADMIDTELEFSRFRFTHTDGSLATHFILSGFEIHGRIRVTDEPVVPDCGPVDNTDDEFDPWMINELED
jgi:hypothetical protein